MITVTTSTTQTVSTENEPLVGVIIAQNGGLRDGETVDQAISRICSERAYAAQYSISAPHISAYFGLKDAATARALDAQLRDSIKVSTTVERS